MVIARVLLAILFGISGIAKFADLAGTRKSITDFGLPTFLAAPSSLLLPLVELACAAALIPAASAWWGAAGVLAMLAVFTLAMLFNLARGRTPDCHCFGQLHSEPIGWKTISRNVLLAAIAGLVVWQGRDGAGVSLPVWFENLGRFEFALLAGAAVAGLQFWFSLHLLRQNGRLMLRLDALESKLGARTEVPPAGLPVNTPAPGFLLMALDGEMVAFDALKESGKPVLLVFGEPDCSLCNLLLPDVAKWQREFKDRIWIGLVSRGNVEANLAKAGPHQVENVLLQKDREVAAAYRVEGTPSAVLITGGRIDRPLAEGADAIRELVSRATLPPPVSKGDSVPSLKLADLTGKSIDLGTLRGRRRLLLFWNPACGFCQRMLSDVKAWERNPPPDAPDLVIISSGSFDSSREQGFLSPVLLDPHSGAGYVFRSGGTPSAVMIDEDGRIASEVGVGAQEVLALAGARQVVNGDALPVRA